MKSVLMVLVMLVSCMLYGNRSNAVFPELANPTDILVDDNQIYISDYPYIFIYSRGNGKLFKKIGGQGEGPGEFFNDKMFLPRKIMGLVISLQANSIFIDSMGRLSEYGIDGKYRKVIKIDPFSAGGWFQAIGNHFIGYQMIRGKDKYLYDTINLYGKNLGKVKELHRSFFFNKTGNWRKEKSDFFKKIVLGVNYKTDGQKIFISERGNSKLKIKVFSQDGDQLGQIFKEVRGIKIPGEFKKKARRHYVLKYKLGLDINQKMTYFPEYFPAIQDFYVSNGQVYIFTYKRDRAKNQMLIFNSQQSFIEEKMIELKVRNPEYFYPFCIYNDKIFQLVEDEENEQWELHFVEI